MKATECCICRGPLDVKRTETGEIYWDQGENALPIKDGRCCVACNDAVVTPARIRALGLVPRAR